MTPRRSRDRLLAILAPTALLVSLLSWGFSSPVGSSPDDDFHMASIWCALGERDGICAEGSTPNSRVVSAELVATSTCYAYRPEKSATCTDSVSQELVETTRGNFYQSNYPPIFYASMSVFASPDVQRSVLVMRAVNALIFVALLTALFFLLRPGRRGPLIWGGMASLIPLGMFLVPSLNPSGWAITSAIVLWLSLVGYLTERAPERAVGLGIIAGIAGIIGAGARGDAAVYSSLAVVLALVMTASRTAKFLRLAILPLGIFVLSVIFFFSARQSSGILNADVSTGFESSNLLYLLQINLVKVPELWSGALGTWGLGWLDTALPGAVWVLALGLYAALAFWGLQHIDLRKAIAVGLAFASLLLVPLYILVRDQVIVGEYIQPRYIYPLLILLVIVCLVNFGFDDLSLTQLQVGVVVTGLSIANATALHFNMRRYVTGSDAGGIDLDNNTEWWWDLPFGPMTVWGVGIVAFSVLLISLAAYVARQREVCASEPVG